MKKIIILICICSLFSGCLGLKRLVRNTKRTMVTVDVKVEELKEVYTELRTMYIQKRKVYLKLKETIYGTNGNTDIWKWLYKNDRALIEELHQLDRSLIKLDLELQELDIKIATNYLSWQDFKEKTLKITTGINKVNIALEMINMAIKTKLG